MGIESKALQFIRQIVSEPSKYSLPIAPQVASSSILGSYGVGGFSYLTNAFNQSIVQYLAIDQDLVTRYIDYEDQEESALISCVAGDTLVRTLGGNIKIEELAKKYPNGEKFKIFAYDISRDEFVIADAHHPRQTKIDIVYEVLLDDGTKVECTSDHKFLLWDNKYVEAKDLKPGDSVMPCRTYLSKAGYINIDQPKSSRLAAVGRYGRSERLYKVIARAKFGENALDGMSVHHIDHDKLNDAWDNLALVTKAEHARIHAPEGMDHWRNLEWTPERREAHAMRMRGNQYRKGVKWANGQHEKIKKINQSFRPRKHKSLTIEKVLSVVRRSKFVSDAAKELGCSWNTVCWTLRRHGIDYSKEIGRDIFNHKVVSVRCTGVSKAVYDLTTDKYHNFVANGVVIHNSAIDIYADDSTSTNSIDNKTIWAESEDEFIRTTIDDMLQKNLMVEETIWGLVRTLCKYGNQFNELIVKKDAGVVGMNILPPPCMRRLEFGYGSDGLVGFIYDPTGQFRMTTFEFIDHMKSRIQDGGKMVTDYYGRPPEAMVFEDWEVAHFRLRGKKPQSFYGFGIGEPVRWIFKRLVLLEDSIVMHRLCLRGDSNVWTTSGYKKIKDIEVGDEVYSFSSDNLGLKKTKVIYKEHNGKDKIFRIFSNHRELYANATHPVLVETEVHQGSGKPVLKVLEYVEVKNIKSGVHKFVTPSVDDSQSKIVQLKIPLVGKKSRLKKELAGKLDFRPFGVVALSQECGVEHGRMKRFFDGEYWLKHETAERLVEGVGYDADVLETIEDWGNLRQANLPPVVDADFAKFFGFMLGDGFLADRQHKSGYVAKNGVGIALGDDEEINQKYIKLFDRYFGPGVLTFRGERKNSYTINSKSIYEFMVLNGYIKGAKNKRIPSWVYECSRDIKLAFIDGLVDADGHRKVSRSAGIRDREASKSVTIELCNKELLEDLRELCMQCGLSVGKKINSRFRDGGHEIENGRVMVATASYSLHFSLLEYEQDRVIRGVEEVEADDILDIGVQAHEHNFVANGVVVHNTRAPSRYAFYVDVSGVPANETSSYLNKVKQAIKKTKYVNPATEKMDQKYSVLSTQDDFFLPVRDGKESTKVESLAGPVYDAIEDIKYFENKLFAGLKVPKPFLTYEESTAKTNLSAEDTRFARTIMRIQREVRNGYKKIARVHLAAKGIDPDRVEFDLRMSMPSAIFELAQLEIRNAEVELADKFGAYAPRSWILREIMGFSDEQILEMDEMRRREEEGGTGLEDKPSGGGSSGALDRVLAKRKEAPTPVVEPEAEPLAASVSSERSRRTGPMSSDEYWNSGAKRNLGTILERLEEAKSRDKAFERRWDRATGLLVELRETLRRRR